MLLTKTVTLTIGVNEALLEPIQTRGLTRTRKNVHPNSLSLFLSFRVKLSTELQISQFTKSANS